jgi:hypothetical protein
MRLLQVTLVTRSLEPVAVALCDRLGLEVAYRDPGVAMFGLENVVIPVGDTTFLEVVAPVTEGTTAGRYLDRRGGEGGYMVILQVDDLAPHRARLPAAGVRVAWEGNVDASEHGGVGWTGIHLHPADTGGTLLSLDQPEPPDSWFAAGPSWREHVRTGVVGEVIAAELQSDAPDALAKRWSEVLGRGVEAGEMALERGRLRFVQASDARPEGFSAVDLAATDRSRAGESFEIGGLRFRLR